jgi:hypothetical protein
VTHISIGQNAPDDITKSPTDDATRDPGSVIYEEDQRASRPAPASSASSTVRQAPEPSTCASAPSASHGSSMVRPPDLMTLAQVCKRLQGRIGRTRLLRHLAQVPAIESGPTHLRNGRKILFRASDYLRLLESLATPYRSKSSTGGYTTIRHADGVPKIEGNSEVSAEQTLA